MVSSKCSDLRLKKSVNDVHVRAKCFFFLLKGFCVRVIPRHLRADLSRLIAENGLRSDPRTLGKGSYAFTNVAALQRRRVHECRSRFRRSGSARLLVVEVSGCEFGYAPISTKLEWHIA